MVSQGLRAGVPTQVHQHNRHTILGGGVHTREDVRVGVGHMGNLCTSPSISL